MRKTLILTLNIHRKYNNPPKPKRTVLTSKQKTRMTLTKKMILRLLSRMEEIIYRNGFKRSSIFTNLPTVLSFITHSISHTTAIQNPSQ